MYWNDPKLYSANIPPTFNYPHRESLNYQAPPIPWQNFSHYMPFENTLPTPFTYPTFDYPRYESARFEYPRFEYPRFDYPRFDYPRFEYPRFDYPTNYTPFMNYNYMDKMQFPYYRP